MNDTFYLVKFSIFVLSKILCLWQLMKFNEVSNVSFYFSEIIFIIFTLLFMHTGLYILIRISNIVLFKLALNKISLLFILSIYFIK